MASTENDVSTIATKETESTKAKRGKVCLTSMYRRRAKGVLGEVEFNERGQPIGKVAAEMQSYIGMLTRQHVPVNIPTWRQVTRDKKEQIWESVKVSIIYLSATTEIMYT